MGSLDSRARGVVGVLVLTLSFGAGLSFFHSFFFSFIRLFVYLFWLCAGACACTCFDSVHVQAGVPAGVAPWFLGFSFFFIYKNL
jgi:hypothetical protein